MRMQISSRATGFGSVYQLLDGTQTEVREAIAASRRSLYIGSKSSRADINRHSIFVGGVVEVERAVCTAVHRYRMQL